MRNFAAIINETKPNALPLFNKLFNMLETIYKDDFKLLVNTISNETEFVFTIGGDGTMVRALKEYPNIPTIGINAGTLGFLTEINEDNLEDACINILNEDYNVEYCTSINDVVISRSNALSMIRFDIFINDKKIKQYNADGFIVSTPIGASAYSLSCGGPFIEPTSKLIELTPIAAHTLVNRSIVVDD